MENDVFVVQLKLVLLSSRGTHQSSFYEIAVPESPSGIRCYPFDSTVFYFILSNITHNTHTTYHLRLSSVRGSCHWTVSMPWSLSRCTRNENVKPT